MMQPGQPSSDRAGRAAQELHRPTGDWSHPPGSAEGITELVLSDDPGSGDRTVLQRYEAGVDTTAPGVIRHPYVEEVYVLEGGLTDITLGQTFTAGAYAYRPIGMPHGPYTSRDGCLMLVVVRHDRPGSSASDGPGGRA